MQGVQIPSFRVTRCDVVEPGHTVSFYSIPCAPVAKSVIERWLQAHRQSCLAVYKQQHSCMQGVRVRVTPLWSLGTQSASTALLELPSNEPVESITVTMALRGLGQPHTQVPSFNNGTT